MASATTLDPNSIYDIHRRPLAELQRNQQAAFINAGCALTSIGPHGVVYTCTAWSPGVAALVPGILGGTGAVDALGADLRPSTVNLALNTPHGRTHHKVPPWHGTGATRRAKLYLPRPL